VEQAQVLSQLHGEKCWPVIEKSSPCEAVCPLRTDVPSYVMAIAQGKFDEALAVIRDTNPFPSVCGRVCHHPCEEVCNRGLVDRPIAIQWLKRMVADMGLQQKPTRVPRTHEERVAIIGSGPAGLTAAYDLVRKGYGVVVYEALPVAGGMLTAGIPEFILPRDVAMAEIDYIRGMGVDIRTDTALGVDFTMDDLWAKGFKAVLLAIGNQKAAVLKIPGSDLEGVMTALPLLKKVRLGERVKLKGKVVIIGGGNVAMDVARSALRLGAAEVHVACLEARKDMPAFSWEMEATEREKVKLHPSLAPQAFRSKDGKRVSGLDFKRVVSTRMDAEGRMSWTLMEGPGSDFSMDADTVIVAIGQLPDVPLQGQITQTARQAVAVNTHNLATNVQGVFAAGDAVSVGGTVTEAIAAGHRAARAIEHYLRGEELPADAPEKEVLQLNPETVPRFFIKKERWHMPDICVEDAVRTFKEVHLGYPTWEGVEEAKRCLNCRSCVNCVFERGQLCMETAQRLL